MARILISSSRYVQGAGEMKKLGTYAASYGKNALVLITASGYKRSNAVIEEGFRHAACMMTVDYFNRECSKKEINRLCNLMDEKGCDVIIGIGGGKTLDTEIIAKSPVRLTVAGMGDALATYFEARACKNSGAETCAGGKVTGAVEKVIEANTLLSGIGFESGGLAGAHAIHNGFTVLEECHSMYHGEKVAFGTITQMVLENIPADELEDIF